MFLELKDQKDIDAHNLKKLRSGMNLVSARLADSDKAHEDLVAKAAYELIKLRMDEMKNVDENSSVDVKRLTYNVKSMVLQSGYVFQPPATSSDKERVMRSKAMRGIYSVASGQQQNLTRQMKKTNVNSFTTLTSKRNTKQMKVKQTDYSRYSDEEDAD